jgi:ketosteroid isomerase-like protein
MSEQPETMEGLARQVRIALDAADLSSFSELLDPDVTWGAPGARRPSCRNRDQVLAWYERGRQAGVRAQISDVSILDDRLLVSLTVRGAPAAEDRGGAALRWQVLTVRDGRIVDIVGFDDREDAVSHAGR